MAMQDPSSPPSASSQLELAEEAMKPLEIYQSYMRSPYLSRKHSSYFRAYTELFERYRNTDVTFVEIGVMDGGSLFMWRDYLGPKARIIGIELNPRAKRWQQDGFEIFIGSQSDPKFWQSFFKSVGPVDVVLDDGGHTFDQQIFTVHSCIPNVRDGGMIVVEDTHTSYYREFGYPSKYSFIEWTKRLIDNINSRSQSVDVSRLPYKRGIYSITIFESMVCFSIRPRECHDSHSTSNNGASVGANDFRYEGSSVGTLQALYRGVGNRFPVLKKFTPARRLASALRSRYCALVTKRNLKRLGDFF
jgi:hypothetical protein